MQGIVQEKRIFVEEISIKNCSLQVGPNAFAKLPLKQLNLQNLGGLNLQTNSLHFKGTCLVGLLVCVETFVITVTAIYFVCKLIERKKRSKPKVPKFTPPPCLGNLNKCRPILVQCLQRDF